MSRLHSSNFNRQCSNKYHNNLELIFGIYEVFTKWWLNLFYFNCRSNDVVSSLYSRCVYFKTHSSKGNGRLAPPFQSRLPVTYAWNVNRPIVPSPKLLSNFIARKWLKLSTEYNKPTYSVGHFIHSKLILNAKINF